MTCDTATGFSIDSGDCTACGACFHTPGYIAGEEHGNYDSCTITPLQSGWLDVVDFDIEFQEWCAWDHLAVDGVEYCGVDGPQGVQVDTDTSITFYSDFVITEDGAYICLTNTPPPPTVSPTSHPTITCDDATAFEVTSGDCHVCGSCFYSPGHLAGNEHQNEQNCTIAPLSSGWLDIQSFHLEDSIGYDHCIWDRLTLDTDGNGRSDGTFCGYIGPQGYYVTPESIITFYADQYVTEDGFEICLSDTFTSTQFDMPTPSPTITCDTATHFEITDGLCHACGNCFYSPNYLAGNDYDHNHDCTITPLQDGWLDVDTFGLESSWWSHCSYDGLIVDGTTYCGDTGPCLLYTSPSPRDRG